MYSIRSIARCTFKVCQHRQTTPAAAGGGGVVGREPETMAGVGARRLSRRGIDLAYLIVPHKNGEKAQRGALRREEQASPKTFETLERSL